jgi:hypothetical protein
MRAILLILAAALAIPGPALADTCPADPYAYLIEDTTGRLGGDLYVVNDLCQTDPVNPCVFSVWVYQETNGHPGLQRGDEVCQDVRCGNPCPVSDTDIF